MTSLQAIVTTGAGQGAKFMALPWVRETVRRLIGFDPFPGTLNLRLVDPRMATTWRRILESPSLRLAAPEPGDCGAQLFRVIVVPDVSAAVVVPDITRHGDDVLELIAPVHLRSRLGLRDQDAVTLRASPIATRQ